MDTLSLIKKQWRHCLMESCIILVELTIDLVGHALIWLRAPGFNLLKWSSTWPVAIGYGSAM